MLYAFFLCSLLLAPDSYGQESMPTVSLSGFIDSYYSKNFGEPANRTNKLRNFDNTENQFVLSLAEVSLQKTAAPAGFRIDCNFGSTNDIVQAGIGSTTLPTLQQGFATLHLPFGEGLTVDAGKFVTHLGYEVIESKDNWNYSRSLLFAWAVPYYHTGIRMSYPVAASLTATALIVNGWNSVVDNNGFKSLGITLNYAPERSTAIILNVIDGVEQSDPVIAGKKKVIDVIAVRQMTESFSLALNVDYGDERTMNGLVLWKGVAVYGRYSITASSSASLRGEILDDQSGYATGTGIRNLTVKEVTATYEQSAAGSMLLYFEMRYDFSNVSIFDCTNTLNAEPGQMTMLIGMIVSF